MPSGLTRRADARSPACSSSACRVHEDTRGWFKENWQRAKMIAARAAGLRAGPAQRLLQRPPRRHPRHPHRAVGQVRPRRAPAGSSAPGSTCARARRFGAAFTIESDPSVAVFVPRGVGNAYQALEDGTTYSYLVNDHWRPGARLPGAQPRRPDRRDPVADPARRGRDLATRTATTRRWRTSRRWPPRKTLIVGCKGQLGRALPADFPGADLRRPRTSSTSPTPTRSRPGRWHEYDLVLNAAAYTAVDAAETPEGAAYGVGGERRAPRRPWPGSARRAPASRWCTTRPSTSSTAPRTAHTEDEPLSPLGVYAQTKAAGDVAVATAPRHYVLRTSWVIGDGKQLRAHHAAARRRRRRPSVVDDQVGRLTFTAELSRATAAPARRRRAVRHLQRQQRRRPDVAARTSRARSSSCPAAPPPTSPRSAPRSTSPARTLRPATAAQRDGPGEAARHRLRAGGRAGRARAATSGALASAAGEAGQRRPHVGQVDERRDRRDQVIRLIRPPIGHERSAPRPGPRMTHQAGLVSLPAAS